MENIKTEIILLEFYYTKLMELEFPNMERMEFLNKIFPDNWYQASLIQKRVLLAEAVKKQELLPRNITTERVIIEKNDI